MIITAAITIPTIMNRLSEELVEETEVGEGDDVDERDDVGEGDNSEKAPKA